jgi:hypothetical protein
MGIPYSVNVVIRDTLNWQTATYKDLRDEAIQSLAKEWDRTFKTSFFECRSLIKNLANDHLHALKNVNILENREHLHSLNSSDYILFSDDDDFYHPEIYEHLHNLIAISNGVIVWPDYVYGYHVDWQTRAIEANLNSVKLREIGDISAFSAVKTNNYALPKSLVDKLGIDSVMNHDSASRSLIQLGGITQANQPLSFVNRHPCSYLVLTHSGGHREDFIRLVKEYAEAVVAEEIHESPFWISPIIAELQQIFRNVYKSRI